MEGAVYLCDMPSILGLSIEHSNICLKRFIGKLPSVVIPHLHRLKKSICITYSFSDVQTVQFTLEYGDLNVGSYGGWNSYLLSMKILWLHARRAGLAY